MTGGIGFSRQAQNADKYNRSLQNSGSKRKKFSSAGSKINHMAGALTNYSEIQAWKYDKLKREGRFTKSVYAILIFIAVCMAIVFILFRL
jgi:hypothetical protein